MTNSRVEIPYAYKLLAQELQTINIVPRIRTLIRRIVVVCSVLLVIIIIIIKIK
jgi:hypothetical protein